MLYALPDFTTLALPISNTVLEILFFLLGVKEIYLVLISTVFKFQNILTVGSLKFDKCHKATNIMLMLFTACSTQIEA
jgi:hypothetical protein